MKQIEVENVVCSGIWADIEVRILDLWEPKSETISQVGLAEDKTGAIKFVKWANVTGIPELEKGKRYLFKNVVSDEYQGRFSIKLTTRSKVVQIR